MGKSNTYIGGTLQKINQEKSHGGYVDLNGEKFYKITNYDQLDPFFMSVASSSDHWLFLSSNGGLSAGRKNPEYALFPYYTVDKIQGKNRLTLSESLRYLPADSVAPLFENPTVSFINSKKKNG